MTIDPVTLLPPLPRTYTPEQAYAELDALYEQIPMLECKGRCHDSCTLIPASELEHRRINAVGKTIGPRMSGRSISNLRTSAAGRTPRCPALGPFNNCTIYAIRPFICRAFGVARDLRCEHGCVPDKILPEGEIENIMARIEQLSRHVTGVRAVPVR